MSSLQEATIRITAFDCVPDLALGKVRDLRVLARGARVELRLTKTGRIGRVLRYRMTSTPGVPTVDLLCRPPGGRTRAC